MAEQYADLPADFIPARESRWFIAGFRWYVKWLFARRFDQIWIRQSYFPASDHRTIYYLNHTSWWDGLIPLLLNEFRFKQSARAVMEDRQMRDFPFFSRIGAFSIDRANPRSALKSLRYGMDHLRQPGRCLFIYPEGKLYPQEQSPATFEGGLAWMIGQFKDLSNLNIVPIGIYSHLMDADRPTLLLNIASSLSLSTQDARADIQQQLEEQLRQCVYEIGQHTKNPESYFERW
jgi:1-acyl-sn-glycerol-3-phosphate acyltransferase